MKHMGGLSKPAGLKAAAQTPLPGPKVHPAAVQKTRLRLPQGTDMPSDPSPLLPNVGKI